MNGKLNQGRAMVVIVALLAMLAGCQQIANLQTKRSTDRLNKQAAASQTGLLSTPGTVTADETANVELAVGRSLEQQGKYPEAIKLYQGLVAKDHFWTLGKSKRQVQATAYHRLAVLSDRKEAWVESAKYYRKALEKSPKDAQVLCDLGYSHYLQQQWPEAEAQLRKALAIDPDLLRAHNNLGLTLVASGRTEEAYAEFAQAGSNELQCRTNFAYALLLNENWESARQEFEYVLKLDPTSKHAQRGLKTAIAVASSTKHRLAEPPSTTEGISETQLAKRDNAAQR